MNLITNLLQLLLFALFVFSSAGLGRLILHLLKVDLKKVPKGLFSVGLGWLAIGFTVFMLGLLHLLYPIILYIIALASFILAIKFNVYQDLKLPLAEKIKSSSLLSKIFIAIIAIFTLINLAGALTPDIEFDSTWYHLPEARQYLMDNETRVWFPSTLDKSSIAPRVVDMLYTFELSFNQYSPTLPQLTAWFSGLMLIAIVYLLARAKLNEEASLFTALAFYSLKMIGWLSQTAYVDLTVAVFAGLVALLIISYRSISKTDNSYALLLGILIGGFLSSKMQSLVFLPAILIGAYLVTKKISIILKSLTCCLVIVSIWYIEIWRHTGNVLLAFQRPAGDEHLGGAQSFSQWVLSIHPKTFLTFTKFVITEQAPLLLALVILLFFWKKLDKFNKTYFLLGWLGIFGWTYVPVHDFRYALPAVILLSATLGAIYAYTNKYIKYTLLGALFLLVLVNFALIFNHTKDKFPVALGATSGCQYLTDKLSGDAWIYFDYENKINQIIGDKKALVLIHNPFYAEFDYADAVALCAKKYCQAKTIDELIGILKKENISFLLLHRPYSLKDFLEKTAIPENEKSKFEKYLVKLYSDQNNTILWSFR